MFYLNLLSKNFQIDRAHAHRAYHDALATHELYQHLVRIAEEGQERIFQPKQLQYKVKRRGPITPAQKAYLNDLMKYHKIELDVSIDSLTKNEASRKIDTIIARYGRMKRGMKNEYVEEKRKTDRSGNYCSHTGTCNGGSDDSGSNVIRD